MDFIDLRLAILIFTVLVNGFLAVVVIKNDPRNATNRIFAALSFITIFWLIDLYLSVNPAYIQNSLLWGRLSIFLAVPQIMCFYLLARTLPDSRLQVSRKARHRLFAITIAVMAIAISPFAFTGVTISGDQVEANPGPGLPIFVAFAISFSVSAVYILLKKLSSAQGHLKEQYKFVVLGLILLLGLLIFTILIPIALTGDSKFVPFAPLYTILFLGLTTFAVIRHKLFDVRLIVARALTYGLLIAALSGLYVVAVFGLATYFIGQDSLLAQRVVPIAAAVILVFTAPFLKRLFDRLTNRIFYRDAYDPQAFLDELNSTIVGNIELGILLRHTTSVIQKNLKCDHCFIEVLPTSNSETRVVGIGTLQLGKEESQYIFRTLKMSDRRTVVTDHLGSNEEKLRSMLSDRNIGLITRLVPRQGNRSGAIAHMIIGHKKSGNIYDKHDIKIIEIISDELLIAIQNALRFEEIQQFNVTLQAKVNEATAKLQRTNKKLRDLDETKDEFISMASHQLRTPLTTIKGYMSMVLEGDAGKLTKPQEELLQQAFISSQRMVYLIADLLNVSRLKSGKFVLDLQPTNLADVVQGEITQLKETANAKGLGFEFKKPKKFPDLMLDETKIRQVIMNFSDNAIYYTPSGGNITIELKEDKNSVYFTVKDTGLGVPKDEKSHLFTKFYRAKNARKARPDGTGLGLFMAKKVVDVLGGNIIFESEEGKGSTFGFTFEKSKLRTSQSAS